MFNANELFKSRITEHMKLLNRYLRYIFNGHFMIALMFMIITLAVYYQKWLSTVGDDFPAMLVIALALGFAVSYNPIQSFLKEPDKVFLIVKEEQMHQYFRLTLVYNYIVQLYVVLIVSAAIGPLYGHFFTDKNKLDFLLLLFIALVIKGWNLVTNWYMLKIRSVRVRRMDIIIRTLLGISLFYFFMYGQFFVIIVVLFFLNVLNDYMLTRKQSGLAWDVLIDNDQSRLALFYRFVSMFADVPQTTKRIRTRRLLASLVKKYVPFNHAHTFDYLYRLSFIRSGDYLSMYIRLTIVGGVFIVLLPNSWLKILFALLFLYMTSFQLITLYHHYRTTMWLDLYPVQQTERQEAFLELSLRLTWIQTIIFACIFLIWLDIVPMLLTLGAAILFNYLFHYQYVKGKINAV